MPTRTGRDLQSARRDNPAISGPLLHRGHTATHATRANMARRSMSGCGRRATPAFGARTFAGRASVGVGSFAPGAPASPRPPGVERWRIAA